MKEDAVRIERTIRFAFVAEEKREKGEIYTASTSSKRVGFMETREEMKNNNA